jgi:hypothetical protein
MNADYNNIIEIIKFNHSKILNLCYENNTKQGYIKLFTNGYKLIDNLTNFKECNLKSNFKELKFNDLITSNFTNLDNFINQNIDTSETIFEIEKLSLDIQFFYYQIECLDTYLTYSFKEKILIL